MAKKYNKEKNILQNVYLLYVLFVAALLHLGYFIFTQDTLLLATFSLSILFVYLVNPNMVIVLATSMVFVDILCLVKKMPEGFDSSMNDASGNDASGNDASGNKRTTTIKQPFSNQSEDKKDDTLPLTFSNLLSKISDIQIENHQSVSKGDQILIYLV
jgi:hypothetical protein